jgi:hypothetical protein
MARRNSLAVIPGTEKAPGLRLAKVVRRLQFWMKERGT